VGKAEYPGFCHGSEETCLLTPVQSWLMLLNPLSESSSMSQCCPHAVERGGGVHACEVWVVVVPEAHKAGGVQIQNIRPHSLGTWRPGGRPGLHVGCELKLVQGAGDSGFSDHEPGRVSVSCSLSVLCGPLC
jgi:hypothetical protein